MTKKNDYSRLHYISQPLRPDAAAGSNHLNATTNAEWLRKECSRQLSRGHRVQVVEDPKGNQYLARHGQQVNGDRVLFP